MSVETPRVVGGDPAEGPASLSRFVLPFAYRRSTWSPPPSGSSPAAYRQLDLHELDPEVERRHYFSPETARVLFERARWFQLERPDGTPVRVDFTCPGRAYDPYLVRIEPPRLVLFEWPQGDGAAENEDDLLATGFLLLDVTFPDLSRAPGFDDLLEFNEVFRTWRRPFLRHDEVRGYRRILGSCPVDLVSGTPLIGEAEADEVDPYFDRWQSLLHAPLRLTEEESGSRRQRFAALFPRDWGERARTWRDDPLANESDGWVIYADHRTFVWTCVLTPSGAEPLPDRPGEGPRPSWSDGRWIKLLNVDSPGSTPDETAQSSEFERDWAVDRTYRRWAERGSLYGFTFHSGAMLAQPTHEPPIDRHFREVYFDQTLLLLYLRVSSFRFSRELTRITTSLRDPRGGHSRDFQRKFRDLRRSFTFFTNLYEFPLVSNQEQGIELYACARKHLDVSEFFDEIEDEVKSAHDYAEMVQTQRQAQVALVLTFLATLGVPIALVTSLFGLEVFVDAVFPEAPPGRLIWGLAKLAAVGIGAAWLFVRVGSRNYGLLERVLFGPPNRSRDRRRERSK